MTTPMSAVDNVERERLASWLEMTAKQADDRRKADPKDKRRLAAKVLRSDSRILTQQAALITSLQGKLVAKEAEVEGLRKDAERLAAALRHALVPHFNCSDCKAALAYHDAAITPAVKPVEDASAADEGKGN